MEISKNRIEKWLPHIVGLLLFSILPLFVFDRNNDRATFWMYSYYYQLIFMIVAFYVNYLVIVPRFFFEKRKIYFFGVILLFAILLLITSQYLYDLLQLDSLMHENINGRRIAPQKKTFDLHPKLVDNFFLLLVVLGFSSGMAIIQQLRKNETKQKEIEKVRVDSELAFLKNQISPHFFFNSLNNIYALIAIDSSKAQKSVEKLSGLMRYLIYDSDIKKVELKKEFDFIRNYIELMQQRLTSKIKLNVNIDTKLPDAKIPPLLFIPFIENAFKHGISYRENSFISISLKAENNKIIFACTNSIPVNKKESNHIKGGIGIVNIKKRLELIYGNLAELKIDKDRSQYIVHLTIPLDLEI
jgi:sensor histidine kinase YesM